MLNRLKLTKQITNSSDNFFSNQSSQIDLAVQTWQAAVADLEFKQKIKDANLPWSNPSWDGELGKFTKINNQKIDYTVVASDGSQIYPDRHAGTNCYLINTGIAILRYSQNSSASFSNEPYFFTDINQADGGVAEFVDSRRHELEIADGYRAICEELISFDKLTNNDQNQNLIYLADGSLIAWHLAGKSDVFQDRFLPNYLQQLNDFYNKKIPFVGYISLPNSKELINLLRSKACDFETDNLDKYFLDSLVDADLMLALLKPGDRTVWFKSNVSVASFYPEYLKPYFAYFHTGNEIARLELPAWILQDDKVLALCLQVVVDQVVKGRGYPVALAEAHGQAVVKNDDRNFFYNLIRQIGNERGVRVKVSRKAKQKQVMGI